MDGCHRHIRSSLLKVAVVLAFIGFSGIGHAQGLGAPPTFAVQPLGLAVQNGGTAILTTTAVSLTSLQFNWLFNGKAVSTNNATVANVVVPLVGTVSTLTLNKLSPASAGSYSVIVKNGVGSVISSNATLLVLGSTVSNVVSFVASGTGLTASGFKIQLAGPSGSNYVIQASSDLKNWSPIFTNAASTGNITYTDVTASAISFRYYRAKLQ